MFIYFGNYHIGGIIVGYYRTFVKELGEDSNTCPGSSANGKFIKIGVGIFILLLIL